MLIYKYSNAEISKNTKKEANRSKNQKNYENSRREVTAYEIQVD